MTTTTTTTTATTTTDTDSATDTTTATASATTTGTGAAADLNAIRARLEACGIVWQADVRVYDPATGCCPVCHRETLEARITGGRLIVRCTAERAISRICNPALTTLLGIGPAGPAALNGSAANGSDPHDAPADADADLAFRQLRRLVAADMTAAKPRPFPLEALPAPLADLAEAIATVKQVPVDYAVMPLLAGLATAIGRRVQFDIGGGWTERAIFWFATIGESGDGKSPAQRAALDGLITLHTRWQRHYQTFSATYEKEAREHNARRRGDQGDPPIEPVPRDAMTNNANMEAIGALASRNPGLLYHRDELSGLITSMNQFRPGGRGDDRENWLTFYNGQDVLLHRLSRRLAIRQPHICMLGGIQRDKLSLLTKEASGDGFIDRFLWCWPDVPMRLDDEEADDAPNVDLALRKWQLNLFERLTGVVNGQDQSRAFYQPGEIGVDGADTLTMERQARRLWRAWKNANEELRHLHTGIMKTAYAKFPYHAARLAIVLHCVDYPDAARQGEALIITETTMVRALTIVEYFRSHTNAVLCHLGVSGIVPRADEDRVYDALCDCGGGWTYTRDIYQHLGHQFRGVMRHLLRLKESGRVEWMPGNREGSGRQGHMWKPTQRADDPVVRPGCLDLDAIRQRLAARERGEF